MLSKRKITKKRKGFALILAIVFMSVFCALSVAVFSMSNMSVQMADNHHQTNKALCNAFSGLEFMRRNLEGLDIIWPKRLDGLKDVLAGKLSGMSGVSVYMPDTETLCVSDIALDDDGQCFSTRITYFVDASEGNMEKYRMKITGKNGQVTRTIQADYVFQVGAHSVFDYGVATKGPLSMTGQAEIDGNSIDPNLLRVEAGVYIEGIDGSGGDSFSITNQASVAGEVKIANPGATYDVGNKAIVGSGDPGSTEYVNTGVDYVDFPVPYPGHFQQYAVGTVIDSSNKSDFSNHYVFDNCTIAAGTNFTFASDTVIRGVLYIETPNKISFAGKVRVQGVIVGDGDINTTSNENTLTFSGQVICLDTETLPLETQYDGIRDEIGTFLLAPGFETDFSGQSNFINGAIAANGVSFSGQAGGTVEGSIINYSYDVMDLTGQSELVFIRSGKGNNIPGFMPYSQLVFVTDSYREIRI